VISENIIYMALIGDILCDMKMVSSYDDV